MKLAVIDECLTRMQIASKLRNLGVWINSTLKVSRTRNATPPPLPDGRGQWNNEMPGGEISPRHAAVSQEDNQVSVIAIMSICFDEIRPERAAYFWRTDRRLVVAKRMLHDLFGPGFSDTSPESRRRSDSLRDGLWPHLLLNLRSPRDYVGPPFVRSFVRSRLWYFLSPLDGASVRESHCQKASTAVRRTKAPCAQASTAVRFSARV